MNGILWNIASFLIAIAILVAFHEWGHFLVARLFKIDVLRFSIGFGRRICTWQGRKGTEYAISAIPLGGYVKMLDEREAPVPQARLPYAFNRQSVWVRLAVVSAGPLFNFIFAFFAYWLMFVNGVSHTIPFVDEIKPNSIAQQAGLMAGDEITAIEGESVKGWRDVIEKMILHGQTDATLTVQVKRGTQNKILTFELTDWTIDAEHGNPITELGFEPFRPKIKPIIDKVSLGEPADTANLKSGDEITRVNNTPVKDWQHLVDLIQAAPDQKLTLGILRQDHSFEVEVTPRARDVDGELKGFLGVQPLVTGWPEDKLRFDRYGIVEALQPAALKTWEISKLTCVLLTKLVTGFVSVNTISGPIGIAQGAGASASGGFSVYLNFLALVSISLAILNLLPIPVLDGGHIFYYLIEIVQRKPVSEKFQEWGFKFGLMFIVLLMALAFYNDINRILS